MSLKNVPVDTDITIDQLVTDPYPTYERLRKESPVIKVAALNQIVLTKADDAKAVKENPAVFSSREPDSPMVRAFRARPLIQKDGTEHRQDRMALAPTFSPSPIDDHWAPLYREIATEYLDRLPKTGVVDLHTALAGPIAARMLAHLAGIPEVSDEKIMEWSQAIIDGSGNYPRFPEVFARSDHANDEMDEALTAAAERVRREPDGSALSVMVNSAKPLPIDRILTNVKVIIGGGVNEPRDALSTIVYGLLTDPAQLEHVKREHAWADAFEEGIRWVAPIQIGSRWVLEDTEIRGHRISKGDMVMFIQASANRDEDLYEAPERFDVRREQKGHQSFSSGPHHCSGSQITRRTVGDILLPMLFEKFPDISLPEPDDVVWSGFVFRGPLNLPVRLG